MTVSAAKSPLICLHVSSEHFTLQQPEAMNEQTWVIASLPPILQLLQHEPANAVEIENAIAEIEDVLMPALKLLPAHASLVTHAPAVRKIATMAGLHGTPEIHLDTDTVERLFNRLADMAYGTPPAQAGLPLDRNFAASLLIVRELLHHGGFREIRIRS